MSSVCVCVCVYSCMYIYVAYIICLLHSFVRSLARSLAYNNKSCYECHAHHRVPFATLFVRSIRATIRKKKRGNISMIPRIAEHWLIYCWSISCYPIFAAFTFLLIPVYFWDYKDDHDHDEFKHRYRWLKNSKWSCSFIDLHLSFLFVLISFLSIIKH